MSETLTVDVDYDEYDLAEAEEEADFERHIEGVRDKAADEIAQEVPFANHRRVFLDARSEAWAFLVEHERAARFDHRRELAFPAETLYTARWLARSAARRTAIRLGLLIDLKPKRALRSFGCLATSLRPRRSARSVRPGGRRSSRRARARSPGSSDDPDSEADLASAGAPA
jgi:hypothetical protein